MFSSRDLALLLPDKAGDIVSLRASEKKEDTFEPLKPKIDPSKKTNRYVAGKAPTWLEEDNRVVEKIAESSEKSSKVVDPRLSRLANSSSHSQDSVGTNRRRRVYEAEIIASDLPDDDSKQILPANADSFDQSLQPEMVDNDVRRKRALERLALEAKQAEKNEDSDDSFESDDDDSDDDSEEDSQDESRYVKPIFVPKRMRETMLEKEEKMRLEEERALEFANQLDKKKQNTRSQLAESLQRSSEMKDIDVTDLDSDAGMPDDVDDPEDVLEFENWKIRELARLKKSMELRMALEKEKQEVERRRNMTEEERIEEDRRLRVGIFKEKEKKKWKFMQKYYHKGVFFMDDDSLAKDQSDVRLRDYSEPTLEDHYNKEQLPSVMQVKNFGKRGRTKYTHLVDQDTTDYKNPLRPDKKIQDSYSSKMSGIGDIDSDGRLHKKSKN